MLNCNIFTLGSDDAHFRFIKKMFFGLFSNVKKSYSSDAITTYTKRCNLSEANLVPISVGRYESLFRGKFLSKFFMALVFLVLDHE